MKKMLLKFAHFILKKYDVIPLEIKDKVLFNGETFKIQSWILSQNNFQTDLEIKMCDCKTIDRTYFFN